jgi:hypothetical protein
MVKVVRTNVALPGKVFELLAVAKEIAVVVKELTGMDIAVCFAIGGNPTQVAWILEVDSVAQLEANYTKMMADAAYRTAVKKLENLVVPGSAHDQIWAVA